MIYYFFGCAVFLRCTQRPYTASDNSFSSTMCYPFCQMFKDM